MWSYDTLDPAEAGPASLSTDCMNASSPTDSLTVREVEAESEPAGTALTQQSGF
jgi:hypothetical protein